MQLHRIDIRFVGYNARGMLWRVEYDGRMIINLGSAVSVQRRILSRLLGS
jgi:hypothetical protein